MTSDNKSVAADPQATLARIRAEEDSRERIERAALRFRGRIYAAPSMDHADVARSIRCGLRLADNVPIHGAAERGHITNRGRFVPA